MKTNFDAAIKTNFDAVNATIGKSRRSRLSFTAPPTLTVEIFAALRPAFPYTDLDQNGGILLARIHPDNNRATGDETVLARALVYVHPYKFLTQKVEDDEAHLGRLTIRAHNLLYHQTLQQKDDEWDAELYMAMGQSYVNALFLVMKLPVIKLGSEEAMEKP
jgi:hypothetical protein